MKSLTSFLILCLLLASTVSAQDGNKRAQKEERIQALRVAFITKELNLTPKESEKFWPIYNEYEAEKRKLRKKGRRGNGHKDTMTDVEADKAVNDSFERQEKMLQLRRSYFDRLKKVIPSKKLVLLEKAEKEFRRSVVKEMKRRKQRRGGNK